MTTMSMSSPTTRFTVPDIVKKYDNLRPENVSSFDVLTRGFETCFPGTCQISDNIWSCPVCLGVPRKPVSLKGCGHIGCYSCMQTIIHVSSGVTQLIFHACYGLCPICRSSFTKMEMIEFVHWPLVMKQFWRFLRVRCDWTGCNYECDPEDVKMHERSCPRRDFVCPSYRCFERGDFETVVKHAEQCCFLHVYCMRCRYPICYTKRGTHDCTKTIKNADNLLRWKGFCLVGRPGEISSKELHVDDLITYFETLKWDANKVTISSVSQAYSPSVTELVASAELALLPPTPPRPQAAAASETQTPSLATISGHPRGRRRHPYASESNQGTTSGLGNRSARRNLFQ